MCYDLDMFGEVIVTLDDVNLWLDTIPQISMCSNQRRNYYAQFNDVANKIKLSKLDGSFDLLIKAAENANLDNSAPLDMFKTVYKIDPIELNVLKCPPYFHICNNPKCKVFIKHLAHEKSAAAYAKRKKYKRQA